MFKERKFGWGKGLQAQVVIETSAWLLLGGHGGPTGATWRGGDKVRWQVLMGQAVGF